MLVVDYPEESLTAVTELLQDLCRIPQGLKVRVLFLSRQGLEQWRNVIAEAKALTLLDTTPITVGPLDGEAAYSLFCSAQESAAEITKTTPFPVAKGDFLNWLLDAPENHRALFIVAAAVQSALHTEESVFGYKGRDVVNALVEREVAHLRVMATNLGMADKDVFARLLAMAAIARALPLSYLEELVASGIGIGLNGVGSIRETLKDVGLLWEHAIHAPTPDILAANLAVMVLAAEPKAAPEVLWAAMIPDVSGGFERIGRLSYDAEVILGIHKYRLSRWCGEAVEGNATRCALLQPFVHADVPLGCRDGAIGVCRTLATLGESREDVAALLNDLSNHLAAVGDAGGALEAIREAVEIRRRLSRANPARFEPDLARSLGTLGRVLGKCEQYSEATAAFKEGVDIIRPFAEQSPHGPAARLLKALENDLCLMRDMET